MRKFFSILGKIFAVLFASLFVATAVVALVLYNLERKALNPQTYKQALTNQNFYEKMPAVIAQALTSSTTPLDTCSSNMIACGVGDRLPEEHACFERALGKDIYHEISSNERTPTEAELQAADACLEEFGLDPSAPESGAPAFMLRLSASDWEFIVSSLLPPEDLKNLTDQAFDSIMAFLNGKTDSAAISLVPLKTRLASESGVNLVLKMMEAQPECTDAQLLEMGFSMMGEGKFEMCNPPDEVRELLQPFIRAKLKAVVADIPDHATLIPTPITEQDDPRGGLITVRLAMRLSPLIPLAFLLGLTLFAVRSLKGWLNWWGIPSLLAGLLAGIAGLFGASAIEPFVQNLMAEKMASVRMPVIVVETGSGLISAIMRQMINPVIWQGFLLAVIGLAMILFGYFYSHRNPKVEEPSPAQTIA